MDSVAFFVAGMFVAVALLAWGDFEALADIASPLWLISLVVLSLGALPVHELVHAAAFKLAVPGCHITFGYKSGMLYAGTPGTVVPKVPMVAVLLAPAVLVTAALVAIALAMGFPVLAWLLAVIHLSGCVGDILMVREICASAACTHVEDTETGVTLLVAGEDEK